MNTFTIFSALTALAAAAPFPAAYPAPPCPPQGTGCPSPTGIFPSSNGTYGHHPSGYAHSTGMGLPILPSGTAVYKREAQLGDMTGLPSFPMPSFSMPSLSIPTEAGGAGMSPPAGVGSGSGGSFPTAGGGSGMSMPTGLGSGSGSSISLPNEAGGSDPGLSTGLGSGLGLGVSPPAGGMPSNSGFASPTAGLGSESDSSTSLSLPAGMGSGSAPAAGLSGFELARRKAQFNGQPSFSFIPLPTASFGGGTPAMTGSGSGIPSFVMSNIAPSGNFPGAVSGVAGPTRAM